MATVEELLEAGDDPNCRGAQQRTPLHRAVGKGHNDVVRLLLDKKADISISDGGGLTPLHWAALFGLVETGEILVENKADVDAQTKSGETPLHLCAEKGKLEFVKFLLAQGAKTDVRDKGQGGGQTAFEAAKKAGQKDVMLVLKPVGEGGGCCVTM
jgi:ankyrin repeat protein